MKKNTFSFLLSFSLLLFSSKASQAQLNNLLKILKQNKDSISSTTNNTTSASSAQPSNAEISSGLKEALQNSLQASINSLSKKDGFLGNQAVKILLPPEAQKAEKALRSIGLGSLPDQLITSLNRAAESAVSEAAPVFINALKNLTLSDVSRILLSGEEDAATNFFKTQTSEELATKFKPIISQSLQKFDVSKHWNDVATRYNQIPLVKDKMEADLDTYVTQKAVNGLFYQVAQEELKIRNNLGGTRTSPLLQKVFGYADSKK